MEIYTIGFTKKTAAEFFGTLRNCGVGRLVDVRANNTSQLAGFAKRDDLAFFLRELVGADYVHEPLLAPTRELLKDYRDGNVKWDAYEEAFLQLLESRRVEDRLDPGLLSKRTVLLCSEATPTRCHRRLVCEYLDRVWGDVTATHL